MILRCPQCGQALNLAGVSAPQVQCPSCRTVIAVPAGPAVAPSRAPSALPGGFSVSDAVPPRRRPSRQRGWQTAGLVGGMLLILCVVGAVALVTWKLAPRKDTTRPSIPVPLRKVQEAIAGQFPKHARFADSGDVQQLKEDEWSVRSHVDVKGTDGVTLRHPFSAVVRREPPDAWHLEQVEIAGRRVALSGGGGGTSRRKPENIDINPEPVVPDTRQEDRTVGRAMRRLADVIGESVALRKTLVVWLFDISPSAARWREDVLGGFDPIYQELEGNRPKGDAEAKLQMAALAFDSEAKFLLEQPTDDPAKLRDALAKITEGKSGNERPFAALAKAADQFGSFRQQGGYVQLVVVTDEAGDDADTVIDQTTATLERQGMQVYVIGKEAPFGRLAWPKGHEDVAGDPRREGPETIHVERLNLQFWQRNFLDEQLEIPSGFGPYWLSRVCQRTGGTFFICERGGGALTISPFEDDQGRVGFDPKLRAKYTPRYLSAEEYRKFLSSNKAAQALIDAGKLPYVEVIATLQFEFVAGNEAALQNALKAAQKGVARLEPKLDNIYQALQPGETDRSKLTEPRWQAAFDLAMGRILATKARVEGYNAMLAGLPGRTFKNKSSTTWVLEPSDTIGAGSKYEGMIKSARKYLERVIQDHRGTPWAQLSQRELSAKLGWEWSER